MTSAATAQEAANEIEAVPSQKGTEEALAAGAAANRNQAGAAEPFAMQPMATQALPTATQMSTENGQRNVAPQSLGAVGADAIQPTAVPGAAEMQMPVQPPGNGGGLPEEGTADAAMMEIAPMNAMIAAEATDDEALGTMAMPAPEATDEGQRWV